MAKTEYIKEEAEQFTKIAGELVSRMTLKEKASLCSGKDLWYLQPVERLGLPMVMVADGPHGLRKEKGNGENHKNRDSYPAVCFPTASALACSFSRELAYEVGTALGEECLKEGVSVLLGPGANQKRSPLCGRNFEYFSEDPIVSGEMAAAMIKGVQSQGIGTSLKHFAVNNQEKRRMTINAVVDERTLRETYLKGFEIAVKKGKPWTVMCAYNRLNGTYCSENSYLLTKILREEWEFEGLVVSDWGAVNDRVEGLRAGLDLEMPGSGGYNEEKLLKAIKDGTLSEEVLDRSVRRIVELICKAKSSRKPEFSCDMEDHHRLAVRAGEESAVLLKNEDYILPGNTNQKAAIIGALAKQPRYQGAGSSKIHPYRLDTTYDALISLGLNVSYAAGYPLSMDSKEAGQSEKVLLEEAVRLAKDKDIVYLFAGLLEGYESEGFDRSSMAMPDNQNRLIDEICAVNPNVVVILSGGAPIELPWVHKVRGILLTYLLGEGCGMATARLLLGAASPSGKLAETWPLSLKASPAFHHFPGGNTTVEYRESIYIGYRYYEKARQPVLYPFGHGLSYTEFEYQKLKLNQRECSYGDTVTVSVTVKNTGRMRAKETVLVFAACPEDRVFRPVKELCGFEKVALEPGEEERIQIPIDTKLFAYYNTRIMDWYAPGGEYQILVGASLTSCGLKETLILHSPDQPEPDYRECAPGYYHPDSGELRISEEDFTALYDRELPQDVIPKRPYNKNNTISDARDTLIGRLLARIVRSMAKRGSNGSGENKAMMEALFLEMPFQSLIASSGGKLKEKTVQGLLDMMNGHYLKGFIKMIRKNYKVSSR